MTIKNIQLTTTSAILMIIIATSAVFAMSLFGDYVCDDWPQVVNNEKIKSLQYIPEYFTKGVWQNTEVQLTDYYRPLFLFFLSLNYQVWGENPFGYHLINLFLHISNCIMVFFLLRKFIPEDVFRPFAGALLFALYPIQVEQVVWISSLGGLASSFFFLASFLAYIHFREKRLSWFLVISVVLFIFSLLSKEPGIVLPAVIATYDYLREKKIYIPALFIYGVTALLFFALMSFVLSGTGNISTFQFTSTAWMRLLEFISGYIKLLFIPWPLEFHLIIPDDGVVNTPTIVFSLCALAAIILYSLRDKTAAFGVLWMAITILPALFLAFSSLPHYASRYLYLPSIGFIIILTNVIGQLSKYKKTAYPIGMLIALIFGILTFQATRDWLDDRAFYSMAIRTVPEYMGGYMGLAAYYKRIGQADKEIEVYLDSVEHVPDKDKPFAYERIAVLYGQYGNPDESIKYFRKFLDLNPNSSAALLGLGNNYLLKNEYETALKYFKQSQMYKNKNYEALFNIAMTYERLGDYDRALDYYKEFLNNAPDRGFAQAKARARDIIKKYSRHD